jgi:hypothetical protein
MIVDDLNVPGFAIAPHKTDPPLIVNPNAALTLAVAVQSLQTIARRYSQIVELLRRPRFVRSSSPFIGGLPAPDP